MHKIICPVCPCGDVVDMDFGGFSATKVEVMACPNMKILGAVSVTFPKSVAATFEAATPQQVRHAEGLVAFG